MGNPGGDGVGLGGGLARSKREFAISVPLKEEVTQGLSSSSFPVPRNMLQKGKDDYHVLDIRILGIILQKYLAFS